MYGKHLDEELRAMRQTRLSYLLQLKRNLEKYLAKSPTGMLKSRKSGGYNTYYYRADDSSEWTHLSPKDRELARRLAQRDYVIKLIEMINKEIAMLNAGLSISPLETLYPELPEGRRALVKPFEETDEVFLEKWLKGNFPKNPIENKNDVFLTEHGEYVRSKSELLIANTLSREGIPYRYECPLKLGGRTFFPDITALNMRTRQTWRWEHVGKLGDPKYANDFVDKMNVYNANGIFPGEGLILTFESNDQPFGTKQIKCIIDKYLR